MRCEWTVNKIFNRAALHKQQDTRKLDILSGFNPEIVLLLKKSQKQQRTRPGAMKIGDEVDDVVVVEIKPAWQNSFQILFS